ncbi:MAG: LysM domain-containing protein [Polyangiaceae bacterium]|jgi:hypothetical protein
MRKVVWLLIALSLSLSWARPARAFTHLVLPGETLAQLASRIYGDPKLEYVIAGANALDVTGGSAIVPGMRLEIPAPAYHHVMQNETWYELALAWLGDTKRADVLANANDAKSWVPPEEGREIVVPAVVSVIAGDNDSDMTIAGRYLGDVNKAWIVDAYNFRKTGPFRRGEVVLVALPDLTLTVRGKAEARDALDRERTEGQGGRHDVQRHADSELPALLADVRGGRYVDAVARGNRALALGELTRPQLATIHRALLDAYVALDAPGLAAGACAAWRANDPTAHLEPGPPDLVSPKIRAACKSP